MDAYSKFAQVYDELMEDVPYEEISQIIDSKIKKYGVGNNIVLDLACGTGTLTKHLSDKGYEMIGADMSAEMLQVAQEKNPGVLFLNQPMEDFELYGTVGAIVCSLDSINYLLDDESLYEAFRLCNNYLEPDGLLIFDINTEYKFKNILSDNIFTFDNEKIFYTWENNYCEEEKLCDFYLTFFVKDGELYSRFDEVHTERAYSDAEITDALVKNGFSIIEKLDNFTDKPAYQNSERVMYICKNTDSIQAKHSKGEQI
jgi:SAM-dependent methyltransferase